MYWGCLLVVLLSSWVHGLGHKPPTDGETIGILYAAHYSGTLHTLTLSRYANGSTSLHETDVVHVPGAPSWITFDPVERIVYASDELGKARKEPPPWRESQKSAPLSKR